MLAYYVHNRKKENDAIVLPDRGCSIAVDAKRLEAFISVDPNFAAGQEIPAVICHPKISVLS